MDSLDGANALVTQMLRVVVKLELMPVPDPSTFEADRAIAVRITA